MYDRQHYMHDVKKNLVPASSKMNAAHNSAFYKNTTTNEYYYKTMSSTQPSCTMY